MSQHQGTVIPPWLIFEGTTLYANQKDIFAMEANTGRIKRTYALQGITNATISQEILYVYSMSGLSTTLQAIRASDGFALWSVDLEGAIFSKATPIVVGETVYTSTNRGILCAFRADDGQLLWRTHPAEHYYGDLMHMPAPTVDGEKVYGSLKVLPPYASSLFALSATDGTLLWKIFLSQGILVPLTVVDGIIYASSPEGCLAFRAQDGSLLWQIHVTGRTRSSPVVVKGVVYLGFASEGFIIVFAISASDGSILWQNFINISKDMGIITCHTVIEDSIYITTNDGRLLALRTDDGTVRWSHETHSPLLSQPLVANNIVYVGVNDGYVSALRIEDGSLLWRTFVGTSLSMKLETRIQ